MSSLIQNPLIPSTLSGTLDATTPRNTFQLDLRSFQGAAAANISLTGLSGDANLQVFREPTVAGGQKTSIGTSSNQGKLSESLLIGELDDKGNLINGLAPGLYTIEVSLANQVSSAVYQLNVAVNADANLNNIFWRNAPSSEAMNWKMNGVTIAGEPKYGDLPAQWQVQGAADLNDDGEDDLIWRDTINGSVVFWMFKGGEVIDGGAVGSSVPLDWQIAAVKDLDGDLQADIVWHNANGGQVAIWMLKDAKVVGGNIFTVGTGWKPVAAVDLSGDKKADIVFHNPLNGAVAIWQMNGAAVVTAASYGPGTSWQPQFFGDFNGDGRTDIQFRNTSSGTSAFWLMDGVNVTYGWTTPSVSADWQVAGLGNFDGSANKGNKDLLWRNRRSGELVVWLMNESGRDFAAGGGFVSRSGQTYNRGTDWTVAGVGDFNSDGKEDILYRNEAQGKQEILLMNGSAIVNTQSLKDLGGNWKVQGLMQREVEAVPFEISGRSLAGGFVSATAFDLGLMDGTATYRDSVSPGNPDYFKFSVGSESNVTLSVAETGVALELFRVAANGSLEGTPIAIAPEMLLSGGTYAVKVSASMQAVRPYALNVTGLPRVTEVLGDGFTLVSPSLALNPSLNNPENTKGVFEKNVVNATFKVKNGSSKAITNLEVGFRISRDGQINPVSGLDATVDVVSNDSTSSVFTIGSLGAGATGEFTVQLQLPDTDAAFWFVDGEYTLGMVVDPNNKLAESNENNNFNVDFGIDKARLPITKTETTELMGTSLRVTGGSFTKPAEEETKTITVSFTVKNAGNIPVTSGTSLPIRFYLSTDPTIDTSDVGLRTRNAGTTDGFFLDYLLQPTGNQSVLGAKQSKELSIELRLPAFDSTIWEEKAAGKPLYLSAWIDPAGNSAKEADTTNNKLDPALVGVPGDLIDQIYVIL
ncbi:FG-GAP-like repeat-containing protein [Leptolyngbya sp. NIES-2104]|uniref:FG-GAP-like repeat-containing protein n=1 Tax=Leptolyngbya sp. NIES-2104 TaxID=1552121 RepID=UPI0006EC6E02|nr:FG-GAP-like repeat-containing protein [Leptolyngbya sp. NIES-2104]GAP97208.1 hypothetical protein NIES2104_37550 [Leptolyngbya sp. NIES-2104]